MFHRGKLTADLPDGVLHLRGDRMQLSKHREQFQSFAPQLVLNMIPFIGQDRRHLIPQRKMRSSHNKKDGAAFHSLSFGHFILLFNEKNDL